MEMIKEVEGGDTNEDRDEEVEEEEDKDEEVEEKGKNKDEEEEEEEEEEVFDLVYKVNEDVTLGRIELCAIYACLRLTWKSKEFKIRWDHNEIRHIVGHALLKLDEEKYHNLDLEDLFECLHNEEDPHTTAVRLIVGQQKKLWVNWIPKLHQKYLDMCGKDEKSVPPL